MKKNFLHNLLTFINLPAGDFDRDRDEFNLGEALILVESIEFERFENERRVLVGCWRSPTWSQSSSNSLGRKSGPSSEVSAIRSPHQYLKKKMQFSEIPKSQKMQICELIQPNDNPKNKN